MLIEFSKMHGLGNDFMVVDGVTQKVFFSNDVIKKLVFHGLRRNGQLDQMTVYHDEFGDPGDPAPAPVEDEGTETEIVIDSGEK